MSRLDKIRSYGTGQADLEKRMKAINQVYNEKTEIMQRQIDEAISTIKNKMMPRIMEFIKTADECEAQGIEVSRFYNYNGDLKDYYSEDDEYIDEFMKFSVYLSYGRRYIKGVIITKNDKEYIAVDTGELIISSENFVTTYDMLAEFLKQYDEFESAVYDYIDSLIGPYDGNSIPEPQDVIERLKTGNEIYVESTRSHSNVSRILREKTAAEGQKPAAIVIACSDSRVMPNSIFSADLGELFVIRVAGNVLDKHQLGSIEYAAGHLGVNLIIVLGHTGCGAIQAAITGHTEGFIKYITDDISIAIGNEQDDYRATAMNVSHGVMTIRQAFAEHPEIPSSNLEVIGAIYNIETGVVDWI